MITLTDYIKRLWIMKSNPYDSSRKWYISPASPQKKSCLIGGDFRHTGINYYSNEILANTKRWWTECTSNEGVVIPVLIKYVCVYMCTHVTSIWTVLKLIDTLLSCNNIKEIQIEILVNVYTRKIMFVIHSMLWNSMYALVWTADTLYLVFVKKCLGPSTNNYWQYKTWFPQLCYKGHSLWIIELQ